MSSPHERLRALQEAVTNYREVSLRNFDAIHRIGDDITHDFSKFMDARVCGVPPTGVWDADKGDYNDAKFSDSDSNMIIIEPVKMGIALCIPSPDPQSGSPVWLRIVISIEVAENEFVIGVDDKPVLRVPLAYSSNDMDRILQAIYEAYRRIFVEPVRLAGAQKGDTIGFDIRSGVHRSA